MAAAVDKYTCVSFQKIIIACRSILKNKISCHFTGFFLGGGGGNKCPYALLSKQCRGRKNKIRYLFDVLSSLCQLTVV